MINPSTTTATIHEALAELKIIEKRRATKVQEILNHLGRDSRLIDPLLAQDAASGGQPAFVRATMQAIHDLDARFIRIRHAIQLSNENPQNAITINGNTRTIAEWLIWKREMANKERDLFNGMRTAINNTRAQIARMNQQAGSPQADLVVNYSETQLLKDMEDFEQTWGLLDGQLSLRNATVTITY